MAHIIVERTFEAPLTEDQLHDVEARMAPCLDLYGVRWIRSFWSVDRQRMICEYEAPDVASVRNVQRESHASFDRMWAGDVLGES
jgi:Nickel responsive protein SCO4226-like